MSVDAMLNEHARARYDGPEAVVCSACGDVVRDEGDTHACPQERRSGLQRRISKIRGWHSADAPRNDGGYYWRRGQEHAIDEPSHHATDQAPRTARERRPRLPVDRRR